VLAAGCTTPAAQTPRAQAPEVAVVGTEAPVAIAPRAGGDVVVASAKVVPAQEARLSFAMGGRVAAVMVAEGDAVEAGQVLVTLETAALEASVARAEASLATAQAQRARLLAGPSEEEITAARSQVTAAEAAVAQAAALRDQQSPEASEAQIAAARVELAAAQAEEKSARITYERLVNIEADEWEQEVAALHLRAAERNLAAAEAGLAQAEKDVAYQARTAQAAVDVAVAQRDAAQVDLDLLLAEATPDEVAAAEANVAQAEAALRAAEAALDGATLRASFGGTVAVLEVEMGQAVLPGQVLLVVADLNRLQVVTTDLSERDVAGVAVGQATNVSVEALGAQVAGHVVQIASQATTVGGDVVYEVTIALDEQPAGLRWGMSVKVEIATE
jgi:HlyD family secretion protein